jgi:hypothetical protein
MMKPPGKVDVFVSNASPSSNLVPERAFAPAAANAGKSMGYEGSNFGWDL